MLNENDQTIERIIEQVLKMPIKMQKAVYWLVDNLEFIDYFIQGDTLTQDAANTLINQAMDKEDGIMLAIIRYKQIIDREGP